MPVLSDWFLPKHNNNHKAKLLRPYSLFFLSLVFVFLQVFLNYFLLTKPAVLGFSSNISPEKVIELTNQERARVGLRGLSENKTLSEAARQKAADMFAFNYWAHVSPSGKTPWMFLNNVGYKYSYAGENLARDFKDPESILRAWMNSPSHKDNITNANYKEIGVAVVDGTLQGVETTLVVQIFGTAYGVVGEKAEPVQVAVAPQPGTLSVNFEKPAKAVTPLDLTKILAILLIGILIGVFVLDIILFARHNTSRFSSQSMAQMVFLLFVLIASLIIREGAIL